LSLNLLKNGIGVKQARALVIILKEHSALKSLCGNNGDETELDMSGKMEGAEDAIMLAAEIVDNEALHCVDGTLYQSQKSFMLSAHVCCHCGQRKPQHTSR
jgi:hypothetical protein